MITGRRAPMRFLAPDAGNGSGGGSGSGVGTTAGAVQNGGGANDNGDLDPKLFESLPWDELDDTTRATLEKIKSGAVATLQSKQHLNGEFQRVDKLARQFQSDKDRLDAEIKKLRPAQQQNQPNDEYIEVLTAELKGAGYKDEDAAHLAPVFANMFKKVGALQTKAIGESLAPMAATVLAGQAQDAFITAQQQDPIGMFQIPEVQQGVWDLVRQRVDKGMETDPTVVLNLAKMVYVDHQVTKAGGAGGGGGGGGGGGNPPGILPATPPTMRTGGQFFTAGPGGSMIPIVNPPTDPNAPRTVMNDDTRNALATSFKAMTAGLDLKKLPDIIKPPTGGRR
jgi:hypothetical protein